MAAKLDTEGRDRQTCVHLVSDALHRLKDRKLSQPYDKCLCPVTRVQYKIELRNTFASLDSL